MQPVELMLNLWGTYIELLLTSFTSYFVQVLFEKIWRGFSVSDNVNAGQLLHEAVYLLAKLMMSAGSSEMMERIIMRDMADKNTGKQLL